jgi:hypothetical protein
MTLHTLKLDHLGLFSKADISCVPQEFLAPH